MNSLCRFLLIALVCAFLSACGGGGGSGESSAETAGFSIGAHYYVWFPQNFRQGYLRDELRPKQGPLLGEYSSRNTQVIEQHIEWASSYGIDYFTLDWWPTRPGQNAAIDEVFLKAANLSKIKFCIFYETIDLGFDLDRFTTEFDEGTEEKFLSDMEALANRYFNHPQYLRIDGRPVVYFYVTRTLSGSYERAFERAREMWASMGHNPYLVADEIYWIISGPGLGADEKMLDPNLRRIKLFDALTAYNLYAPSFTSHQGYPVTSAHLPEISALYAKYRAFAPDTPIIPGVLPGFNDRGTRIANDHYPIPREASPGAGQASTLDAYIQQVGIPYADSKLNMMVVTSWNEWNEDTAIEPIGPAVESSQDSEGGLYTQGFNYGGTGFEALEVLRGYTQ